MSQTITKPDWDRLPADMTTADINRMIELFLEETLGGPVLAPAVTVQEADPFPFKPGDKLGDAVLVGDYEDGSDDWHAARRGGIGGSEISCILHLNNWKSRYVLWLEKVGTVEPEPIDPTFSEWGHRHEPTLARKFGDDHPEFEVLRGGSWTHKDHVWMKANPDGLLRTKANGVIDSLVEFKTSQQGHGWGPANEDGTPGDVDGVPRKYVAQVRWYMAVFGFFKAHIVVLIGPFDYREYIIYADPFEKVHAFQEGEKFMALVESQTAPEIDGGPGTYEYLRTVNPSIITKGEGSEVTLPVEIGDMVLKAKAAHEASEVELLRAKGHLLAHMGPAKAAFHLKKKIARRDARGENVPFVVLV